jgi:hypothetical protein
MLIGRGRGQLPPLAPTWLRHCIWPIIIILTIFFLLFLPLLLLPTHYFGSTLCKCWLACQCLSPLLLEISASQFKHGILILTFKSYYWAKQETNTLKEKQEIKSNQQHLWLSTHWTIWFNSKFCGQLWAFKQGQLFQTRE